MPFIGFMSNLGVIRFVLGWKPTCTKLATIAISTVPTSSGQIAAPTIAFLLLLAAWQGVAAAGLVPAEMLPAPTRVVSAGAAERTALLRHAIPTLIATVAGFALSVSVAWVTATVLDVTRGRSTVLVTHDLSALAQMDEVVVLDRGRAVQRGTHEELLARPGLYRQMWDVDRPAEHDPHRRAEVTAPAVAPPAG